MAGNLSFLTTTTSGTASAGGLQHQSSLYCSSQSAPGPAPLPEEGSFSATAKSTVKQQRRSLEAKKPGSRNVSFGTKPSTYSEASRAKFALLSERKSSLPNGIRINRPDSAESSRRVSSRLKSCKI